MNTVLTHLKRPLLVVLAALLMVVSSAANFLMAQVGAAQVTSRYVKMRMSLSLTC